MLLPLCLDSDKGIFKFLEITAEAGQFYFHPRINHLFPWSPAHVSWRELRRGRRKMRREGGVVLPARGASRFGAPFPRQRHDTNLPTDWPTPPRGSASGDTHTMSAPRARPLRNSFIRILFTALWQAIIIDWLKPRPWAFLQTAEMFGKNICGDWASREVCVQLLLTSDTEAQRGSPAPGKPGRQPVTALRCHLGRVTAL